MTNTLPTNRQIGREQRAILDAAPEDLCWCGKPAYHHYWCREHAPSCRSGAHFFGNCRCEGTWRVGR